MNINKKNIREALESNELEAIVFFTKENRRVLSLLVRLAYDKETVVGWRAIKAIGLTARELAKTDYDFLRETVRKLLWSLTDESGGIGWAAPEIVGEIVSADPERFLDIVPIIAGVYEVDEKTFRPGVLYALTVIGKVRPDTVKSYCELAIRGLSDEDPLVRYHAVEFFQVLKCVNGSIDKKIKPILEKLLNDPAEVWIYEHEHFLNKQIGEAISIILREMPSIVG